MTDLMAPHRQYLDAVAGGGRPAREDLDEVIADSLRGELGDTTQRATWLRSKLHQATDQILALHGEGASHAARQLAKEYAAELDARLPEHRPTKHQGSARDIIESIPRVG